MRYEYNLVLHEGTTMTCAIRISKLRNNYINVVGGMRIIIHVQQWLYLNYTESPLQGCQSGAIALK